MNRWFRKGGSTAQAASQGQSRWRRLFNNFKRDGAAELPSGVDDDEVYMTCPNCNHTQVSRQSYVCPRCHRDLRYG